MADVRCDVCDRPFADGDNIVAVTGAEYDSTYNAVEADDQPWRGLYHEGLLGDASGELFCYSGMRKEVNSG